MKTKLSALVLSGALLLSVAPLSQAKVVDVADCDFYADTWSWLGSGLYDYAERDTVRVKYKNDLEVCKAVPLGKTRSVLNKVYERKDALINDAKQSAFESIKAGIKSGYKVGKLNADITGDLRVKISPSSNGRVTAYAGGFGLNSSGEVRVKGIPGWIVKGKLRLTIGRIDATADYNLATGRANNLNVSPQNIHIDAKLSFLGLSIPVLSDYVENKVESKLRASIDNLIETKANTFDKRFFSLDEAIPNGEFVYQGRDLGQEAKDQLFDLLSGQSIEVVIGGGPQQQPGIHKIKAVQAKFADRLSFEIVHESVDFPFLR